MFFKIALGIIPPLTNKGEIVTLKDRNQYWKTAEKRRVTGGCIDRESQKLKRDDDGFW